MKAKLVSIILTSYNEEKNIGRTIKDCRVLKKFFPIEIIVADAASKDKTIEIAKKFRVDRILRFPFKRGKGADFWAGSLIAKGHYIIQIDTDHQFQPNEIPVFVKTLRQEADIVMGTRFEGGNIEKGSVTFRNLIGNRIMSTVTISAPCLKAFTKTGISF